jgi:hypothetical protein
VRPSYSPRIPGICQNSVRRGFTVVTSQDPAIDATGVNASTALRSPLAGCGVEGEDEGGE